MLAQSFLTAVDLGLSDIEHKSLVTVLGMLERGEIREEQFSMATTGAPAWFHNTAAACRTPACICGWARHVAGVTPRLFDNMRNYKPGLRNLFQMAGNLQDGLPHDIHDPEEAAIALRAYLTTGRPVWGRQAKHIHDPQQRAASVL
jgi:hypothetical protein